MPEPKDGLQDPKNPATPPASDPSQTPPKPEGDKSGQPADAGKQDQGKTVPHGAFHEEREKRKALDAKMEQIKALYGDKIRFDANGNVLPPENTVPSPAMAQPDAGNVHTVSDVQKQVDEMWDTDPKKAVRAEIALALNWFDQQSAAVDLQRDAARAKFNDFSRWESEINTYLRRLPLQQRTQPGIIDMAYNYVKGSKIDQILAAEKAEIARKLAAGEAVQGLAPGTSGAPPAQPSPNISEAEARAAAAMGMSTEDYLKHKVTR